MDYEVYDAAVVSYTSIMRIRLPTMAGHPAYLFWRPDVSFSEEWLAIAWSREDSDAVPRFSNGLS